MFKNHNILSLPMILIYGLAFVILWEWLRPIPVITDTANLTIFVWFTLFCFVIMYLRMAVYFAVPLIFIAIIYSLHEIFFEGSFLRESFQLFLWLREEFLSNVSYLKYSELINLSFEFRTFILLVALAIISYLIHYWLFHVKKIFFFLLITFVFITVIDTFTVYDASSAIVRLFVAGFLLTTILFKVRLEATEEIVGNHHRGLAWLNLAVFLIAFITVIAFYAPKYLKPLWPDPVPLFQRVISEEQSGKSEQQTIGYSENDETLGGGLADDSLTVFTAVSKVGHYWRGESKEIYTGKGWESIDHELNKTFRYSDSYEAEVAISTFDEDIPSETEETTITMVNGQRFWHFFYAGELLGINELKFYDEGKEKQPYRYLIDYVSGKVGTTAVSSGKPLFLKEYTFTHKMPNFVIDVLKNSPQNDPEYIQEVYLQLPDLPDRIGDLASEITADYDNRYQKVKAIEGYFSKNNFKYETEDVAIPGENQDYVDQFLFETQQGYCNNYSTAMVVMLRTVDIPARWVKGFTQGEIVKAGAGQLEAGYQKYEISNSDAHSWVEVYFEDVGWVPFEPTSGFSNTFGVIEAVSETENDELEADQEKTPDSNEELENPSSRIEDELDSDSNEGRLRNDSRLKWLQFSLAGILTLAVVLGIGILILKRKKLITLFFLYIFKLRRNDRVLYLNAYQRLLWLLDLHGHKRSNGETLREYAIRIDELFNCAKMVELTLSYEKLYYGNQSDQYLWEEKKVQWEWLVAKISS